MKITLEFTDIEKFFIELPRFAALMSMAGKFASFDKIKASDLETFLHNPDLPHISQEEDGTKVATGTPEQVEKVKAAQKAATEALKTMTEEAPAEEAMNPPEVPFEEEPKKSTPKKEKAAEKLSGGSGESFKDTDVRKMLNKLIKSGHRDEVKQILSSFGAENFSKLDEKYFAQVMEKGREILKGDENG